MPNTIKYSTTGDTFSLKKGNFFIGTGDVGKGPSNVTKTYNGVSPAVSGYTVYQYNASQESNISYYSSNNDAELITFTNSLSGQTFTSVTQCFNWYATQTNNVCVNRDYEDIVTNGLVLNLDAGFTPSYSRTGTTWYDLSYSGFNGSLINGPTYSSANGGSILFDGVNDNLTFNPITFNNSEFTAEIFGVLPGPINLTNRRTLFGNELSYEISEPTTILMRFNIVGSGTTFINIGNLLINTGQTFHHVLVKRSGNIYQSYQNGVLRTTINPPFLASNGQTVTSATSLTHTYNNFGTFGGSRNYNGNLFLSRIYNRDLSSSEILKNYQAQFPRFLGENIVTNGLVNYLDAGYNVSYPGTGTTWNNISGLSGGTGTLTNGTSYSGVSGGTMVFDGTDDYVTLGSQSLITNNFTISLWYKLNTESTKEHFLFSVGYSSANSFLISTNSTLGGGQSIQSYYVNAGGISTGRTINSSTITNTQIVNLTYTRNNGLNIIYINGIEQTSRTFTESLSLGSSLQYILGYGIPRNKTTAYLQGNIYINQIYNRSLSQTEITQNFNSQKSRFGL